jgi:fructose-1,6-bisphosphatase I
MNEIALRLSQHLRAEAAETGDLVVVLDQIAVAGKLIARELGRASLIGQLGLTGDVNVQGEAVKKLDVWANDVMVRVLDASGVVCTMVSEEMDEPLHLAQRCPAGQYVVCFDPVDGSSNLDVNGIVGTIFSIRRRRGRGTDHAAADAVQPGSAQVAAGYVMYGPSTALVYTAGKGVHAFTLDPTIGEFVRARPHIQTPGRGHIYSVNEAHAPLWAPGIREYIDYLRARDPASGRPYTGRYVGSMVADVHRTLLEGGIFLYPGEVGADGKASGKLRLQYEAAPMAFLMEQAGGKASTGRERIQDIHPASAHQRVPILIGSRDDVTMAEEFVAGRR